MPKYTVRLVDNWSVTVVVDGDDAEDVRMKLESMDFSEIRATWGTANEHVDCYVEVDAEVPDDK